MVRSLSTGRIQEYRTSTYRLKAGERLTAPDEAIDFVNQRGFVFFWPVKGYELPSLWAAVAGDRPVPSDHDDPGHITWRWKDSLLGEQVWYYAKILRKRATIISPEAAPYFYALTENYGAPEEDYLLQYEQGRLGVEEKNVYEVVLKEGPVDTITLRRAAHLASSQSKSRFERALTNLQVDFKILPVGVAEVGAWRYAFTYDVTHRHFPDLPEKARWIPEEEARQELARRYFLSLGAAPTRDLTRIFSWRQPEADQAVRALEAKGILIRGLRLPKQTGEWIALSELAS